MFWFGGWRVEGVALGKVGNPGSDFRKAREGRKEEREKRIRCGPIRIDEDALIGVFSVLIAVNRIRKSRDRAAKPTNIPQCRIRTLPHQDNTALPHQLKNEKNKKSQKNAVTGP